MPLNANLMAKHSSAWKETQVHHHCCAKTWHLSTAVQNSSIVIYFPSKWFTKYDNCLSTIWRFMFVFGVQFVLILAYKYCSNTCANWRYPYMCIISQIVDKLFEESWINWSEVRKPRLRSEQIINKICLDAQTTLNNNQK